MRPPRVMVAGRWDEQDPDVLAVASELGGWLSSHGCWVITGGGAGVAQACAEGALGQQGITIEFNPLAPGGPSDENYVFTVHTANGWDGRSLTAVQSCDALVVLGGQAGSLLELVAAYHHGVPTFVIRGTGELVARLDRFLLDGRYLDERRTGKILLVDTLDDCTSALAEQVLDVESEPISDGR